MKNKNLLSFFSVFLLTMTGTSYAQMVGTDAYLKGNYVELGIAGAGGFEGAPTTTSPPLPGMHFRSSNPFFGFVANPQMNAWTSYDGDFFTPGTPENGWGFEIGTTGGPAGRNNCAYLNEIPGAITYWNYTTPTTACEWEGDYTTGTNVHFRIRYTLDDTDLFYITTIYVTNNTASTINDFYYFRNIDPDNNVELSGDFTTQNTIVSQITAGGANTSVTASSSTPWSSLYDLIAVDADWKACYGGFANRDASDLWNGVGFTQTVGATNFADEAISLVYHIPALAPGNTSVFKFASAFNASAVSAATSALMLTTGMNENAAGAVQLYPNPFAESTTLHVSKDVPLKDAELHVFDVTGREVLSRKGINTHDVTIEKNGLSAGAYVYRFINNAEVISTGKLIVK
jgi:hypothetical protein